MKLTSILVFLSSLFSVVSCKDKVVNRDETKADHNSVDGKNSIKPSEVKRVIDELEMSINNGGFDQYFFNSYGEDALEAAAYLRLIKADKMADIVDSAISKFPDGKVPKDRDDRQDILEKISPESDAQFKSLRVRDGCALTFSQK